MLLTFPSFLSRSGEVSCLNCLRKVCRCSCVAAIGMMCSEHRFGMALLTKANCCFFFLLFTIQLRCVLVARHFFRVVKHFILTFHCVMQF